MFVNAVGDRCAKIFGAVRFTRHGGPGEWCSKVCAMDSSANREPACVAGVPLRTKRVAFFRVPPTSAECAEEAEAAKYSSSDRRTTSGEISYNLTRGRKRQGAPWAPDSSFTGARRCFVPYSADGRRDIRPNRGHR